MLMLILVSRSQQLISSPQSCPPFKVHIVQHSWVLLGFVDSKTHCERNILGVAKRLNMMWRVVYCCSSMFYIPNQSGDHSIFQEIYVDESDCEQMFDCCEFFILKSFTSKLCNIIHVQFKSVYMLYILL